MSSNDEKLAFVRAVGQVVMTWIAFIMTGLVTLIMLAFLVYCIIKQKECGDAATWISGTLNIFLLALLQIIYKSLFPSEK
ncbi:MAG: hypothetical protein ACYCSN_15555 [Acidobacteriaceae bacterium]